MTIFTLILSLISSKIHWINEPFHTYPTWRKNTNSRVQEISVEFSRYTLVYKTSYGSAWGATIQTLSLEEGFQSICSAFIFSSHFGRREPKEAGKTTFWYLLIELKSQIETFIDNSMMGSHFDPKFIDRWGLFVSFKFARGIWSTDSWTGGRRWNSSLSFE